MRVVSTRFYIIIALATNSILSLVITMYVPRGLALKVVLYVVDIQRLLLCWRMFGADCDSRTGGRFKDGLSLHTK